MAKHHQMTIPAHPNVYQFAEREITVRFCEPEQGISTDTGLLLLFPDIGEPTDSEASASMRERLADKYNVVTIQCEYFGHEFMGGIQDPEFHIDKAALKSVLSEEDLLYITQNDEIDFYRLLERGSHYPIHMTGYESLNESIENYNDFGLMQALDHLTALLVTAAIIKDNGYSFHAGKVMAYGTGHGAYLAYLCNAFAPKLFHVIIDNSAWLFPPYFTNDRTLSFRKGQMNVTVLFDYLAKRLPHDKELLNLSKLYKKIVNRSNIISFHGENDQTTSAKSKGAFCQSIKSCMYNEINELQLKGNIFTTTGRNLGADPILFYEYVMENLSLPFEKVANLQLPLTVIHTNEFTYTFDYSSGLPILERTSKKTTNLV